MSENPQIQAIMFKRRNGQFKLAFCRGMNKGCDKMRADKKPKKPCDNCYIPEDENMTIGEVYERLNKGDA